MKKLKILSAGRNCIKKIEKLDDVAGPSRSLAYNFIGSLDGLSNMQNLEVLYMSNNKIKDFSEMGKLKAPAQAEGRAVVGTRADGLEKAEQRRAVLAQIPQVQKIDGEMVTGADRTVGRVKNRGDQTDLSCLTSQYLTATDPLRPRR